MAPRHADLHLPRPHAPRRDYRARDPGRRGRDRSRALLVHAHHMDLAADPTRPHLGAALVDLPRRHAEPSRRPLPDARQRDGLGRCRDRLRPRTDAPEGTAGTGAGRSADDLGPLRAFRDGTPRGPSPACRHAPGRRDGQVQRKLLCLLSPCPSGEFPVRLARGGRTHEGAGPPGPQLSRIRSGGISVARHSCC